MTVAELEGRVLSLELQKSRLLQVATTEQQKAAVALGHDMMIDELKERIEVIKNGG